jgi:hypothetical protein
MNVEQLVERELVGETEVLEGNPLQKEKIESFEMFHCYLFYFV